MFRVKFSFNEAVRKELFRQVEECNSRLKRLLHTSDRMSALETIIPDKTKRTFALEKAFESAWKKSGFLFKAIQKAWQCSCQQYHFANLQLQHRSFPGMPFGIILMFLVPTSLMDTPWSWRELQCEQTTDCSLPQKFTKLSTAPKPSQRAPKYITAPKLSPSVPRQKKLAVTKPATVIPRIELDMVIEPSTQLCQLLGSEEHSDCIGTVIHGNEIYHLHPITKRNDLDNDNPLTLRHVLTSDFTNRLSRRQWYLLALLIASSVAQLQFTPWLKTSLAKEDIILLPSTDDDCSIHCYQPFILQGFPRLDPATSDTLAEDCNFSSLSIILLELCFNKRLEDQPFRQAYPGRTGEAKQAFDLAAALKWFGGVHDKTGKDYASAVKWCFYPNYPCKGLRHTTSSS